MLQQLLGRKQTNWKKRAVACSFLTILLALAMLAGCQSFDYVQFVVPHIHEDKLLLSLHAIAKKHAMEDKTGESKVSQTLVLFNVGDLSYTHLGARLHEDLIVVDLIFRSAGLGGELFHQLEPEIEQALREIYGNQVSVVRDRTKLIPFQTGEKNERSESMSDVTQIRVSLYGSKTVSCDPSDFQS
jgi:hypothetical protein